MSETRIPIDSVGALRDALEGIAPEVPIAWRAAEAEEYPEILDALQYADGAGLELLISFTERPSNAHYVSIAPAPDGGAA
ncbi:MAG: hypothetical protein HC834_09640 [Rhodospirillales bacterium]|nr:hypothetical protein [Rhodospirillales bacterium]